MNILVITPDGDIGRPVLAELLSPEFTVRVITDDSAGLPEEWLDQVEMIASPTDNAGTLLRALAGVGSVLWCIPAGTDQEIEPFARALSRAMREAEHRDWSRFPRRVANLSTARASFPASRPWKAS